MKNTERIVTITVIQLEGHALWYTSKELRSKEQFMTAVVAWCHLALGAASKELKNNERAVTAAVM